MISSRFWCRGETQGCNIPPPTSIFSLLPTSHWQFYPASRLPFTKFTLPPTSHYDFHPQPPTSLSIFCQHPASQMHYPPSAGGSVAGNYHGSPVWAQKVLVSFLKLGWFDLFDFAPESVLCLQRPPLPLLRDRWGTTNDGERRPNLRRTLHDNWKKNHPLRA